MIQILRRVFSSGSSGKGASGDASRSPLSSSIPGADSPRNRRTEPRAEVGLQALPLSIHPDPAYYVETKTSPYDRVRRVIDASDGGVIGITGERGAGKSVLLNTLISDYSRDFLTVNVSAPISSSREMEFFLMLFRHLTQCVIAELRTRMRTNQDDIDAIGRAAIQIERRRFFLVTCAVIIVASVGSWSFYGSKLHALRIDKVQIVLADLGREKQGLDSRAPYLSRDVPSLRNLETLSAVDLDRFRNDLWSFGLPSLIRLQKDLTAELANIKREQSSTKGRTQLRDLSSRQQKYQAILDAVDDYVTRRQKDIPYEEERAKAELTSLQKMTWPWLAANDTLFTAALAAFTVFGILAVVPFLRRLVRVRRNPSQMGLLIYSGRLASKLDYELTRSAEQSLEFAPVSWLKGSSKRSNQEKARGLSLPELTADYIDFVSNVLRVFPGKLIICIDELDKVTDLDQVRFILREIKGALYVKGTFYILSISNDALRSFEGRLGDQRDIFESTFDDVFVVRPLDLESSMRILSNRLTRTLTKDSEQQAEPGALATIAVFSAGNARDLIRGFRECALRGGSESLMKADEAWKLLFSRRMESIVDRVMAATGVDAERTRLLDFVENNLTDMAAIDESVFADLRSLRSYFAESAERRDPEKDDSAVLRRFIRYLTELEILLYAREKVATTSFGEKVLTNAAVIMRAYQALPFSVIDAQRTLAGITDVPSNESQHVPCPSPTVKSLQQPVSDRNIASSNVNP